MGGQVLAMDDGAGAMARRAWIRGDYHSPLKSAAFSAVIFGIGMMLRFSGSGSPLASAMANFRACWASVVGDWSIVPVHQPVLDRLQAIDRSAGADDLDLGTAGGLEDLGGGRPRIVVLREDADEIGAVGRQECLRHVLGLHRFQSAVWVPRMAISDFSSASRSFRPCVRSSVVLWPGEPSMMAMPPLPPSASLSSSAAILPCT